MTGKDLLRLIARQRRKRCRMILEAPERFKICFGCQSLCFETNAFCPFCNGYGFETDRETVVEMARLLGERPLAAECAVLPRQTTVRALTYA